MLKNMFFYLIVGTAKHIAGWYFEKNNRWTIATIKDEFLFL